MQSAAMASQEHLESRMRAFLADLYPNFELTHVIELREAVQFVLVDSGDFDGLTQFCEAIRREFDGSVELKRQSTQSFQLEVTVPLGPRRTSWTVDKWLPWALALVLTLGICLWTIFETSSEIRPLRS